MESVALILYIWKSQQSLLPVWLIWKSASALDEITWKITGNTAAMVKRSGVIGCTQSDAERIQAEAAHWRVKRSHTMWSRAFQQGSSKHLKNIYKLLLLLLLLSLVVSPQSTPWPSAVMLTGRAPRIQGSPNMRSPTGVSMWGGSWIQPWTTLVLVGSNSTLTNVSSTKQEQYRSMGRWGKC